MAKSLAVIITKVPYGTEEAFAGARLALAVLVSGCKVDIKVVLIGDGTLNALVSQKPQEIGMPSNLEALKQVIEMGAEIYCVDEDLNMLVQDPKILEGIKTVSWAEARDVVQQQDLITTF
jgi:tRNA 2-thiouridine synthesizing protein C